MGLRECFAENFQRLTYDQTLTVMLQGNFQPHNLLHFARMPNLPILYLTYYSFISRTFQPLCCLYFPFATSHIEELSNPLSRQNFARLVISIISPSGLVSSQFL